MKFSSFALLAPLGVAFAGCATRSRSDAPVLAARSTGPRPSATQSAHEQKLRAQNLALVRGLRGQLKKFKLPPSKLLSGRSVETWVYLPPGYTKSASPLPVVYVMHGNPGGLRDPFVNASVHRVAEKLITTGKIEPVILVGWEGSGPQGFGDPVFYLDRRDGKYQMESWMVRELVPWVDGHFRTLARPEARALLGFSAGGYGAANLSFKHPDVWAVAASHAGFFDPNDFPGPMTQILGPRSKLWSQNSPILRAREVPVGERLHFYMDCGRDDPLIQEFEKMEAELRARDIDFEARIFAGAHDWTFLHAHYFDSLGFCDARFRELREQSGKPNKDGVP